MGAEVRSREGERLLSSILALPPDYRKPVYDDELTGRDWPTLLATARRQLGSRHGLWQDDPVDFIERVIGDTLWSRQRDLLRLVRDHRRVSVPASHSVSKSFTGADLVAWYVSVWPVGTAKAITTAPTMRQVTSILWGSIRGAHERGRLDGTVQQKQWKIGDRVVAFGMSPPDWDEAAVQGEHSPHLLFVVDEAGGIGHTLGRAYAALMSQPDAKMVLLGNAPTDEEGSWFEECSEKSALYETMRIAAFDTPAFTGEPTGRCTTCPVEAAPHRVALHLTSPEWVDEVVSEFGDDSAFYVARVLAQFPQNVGRKAIPYAWVELAANAEPDPHEAGWVRLGADIASDGGDEFVIARAVDYAVEVVHRSSGAENADPVQVAGRITEAVRDACDLRDRLGDDRPVTVKIDASGLGWGVAGLVRQQLAEQNLPARAVPVRGEDHPVDDAQFKNARSEMWWNTRRLMRPTVEDGYTTAGRVRLVGAPTKLLAQLSAPRYANDSSGRIIVEKKREMKARGVQSPDLADAVNLALYEPHAAGSVERASATVPLRPSDRAAFAPAGGGVVIPLSPTRRP